MRSNVLRLTGVAMLLGGLAACDGDGAVGREALLDVKVEPAGENCVNGGSKIESGTDLNGNGKLDAGEIESTSYACNGQKGADGKAAEAGADGKDGANGHGALVTTSADDANGACPGGYRVDQGIDANDDGELAESEIRSSFQVCAGKDGTTGQDAKNMLLAVTVEAAGANCTSGGQKITSGTDLDSDGSLAEAEVQHTEYVCNGANGSTGLNSLSAVTTEAAGANCANGGLRIDLGLDDDASGTLEAGEIDTTRYVCDGAAGTDGINSLVSVVDEPAGANCAAGGERITYGLDEDGDGTLDPSEVSGTRYVCDGEPGAPGASSIVKLAKELPGANCATGGQRIDSGVDDDGDEVLDADEIDATGYVCNGNEPV